MKESVPAPATSESPVSRLEQLMAMLDETLPKTKVNASVATPVLSPEQFDSLIASW
jgi:hypothetical protein